MGRLGVVKVMSLSSFALVVGGLPGVHGAKWPRGATPGG